MTRSHIVALLILACAGCATWQVTPARRAVLGIAGDLRVCRADSNGWPAGWAACNRIAAERCELVGQPRDCGATELYMDCITSEASLRPVAVPPYCAPPTDSRTTL